MSKPCYFKTMLVFPHSDTSDPLNIRDRPLNFYPMLGAMYYLILLSWTSKEIFFYTCNDTRYKYK